MYIKSIFIFIIILCFKESAIANDSLNEKSRFVGSSSSILIIEKKVDELSNTLKAQEVQKDNSTWTTSIIAILAVVVSLTSAFLNYFVLRGQSISLFRKNWNNSLIDDLKVFITNSTALFFSLKSGVLPTAYEAEISDLRKINHSVQFRLHEIDLSSYQITELMFEAITLIENAKKSPQNANPETFNNLVSNIVNEGNVLLRSNWKKIIKFK